MSSTTERSSGITTTSSDLFKRHDPSSPQGSASPATLSLAVLDVDGTLLPGALGVELLRALIAAGVCQQAAGAEVFAVLERYRRGDIDFPTMESAAYAAYARALAGVPCAQVEQIAADVWEAQRGRLFPFVRPLVTLLRNQGYTLCIISGSPDEIVRRLADELGIQRVSGARFARSAGKYTGQVELASAALGEKGRILDAFIGEPGQHRVCFERSLALGDSLTDVALFERVGLPLAFEPDPALRAVAAQRSWAIATRDDALERVQALLEREARRGKAEALVRARRYVEAQVERDGAVRGKCESRVLESVLTLHLLEQLGGHATARAKLRCYLAESASRSDEGALDAALRRHALGATRAADAAYVRTRVAQIDHFTARRKRATFSLLLTELGLTKVDPTVGNDLSVEEGELHPSWGAATLSALRVLHAAHRGVSPESALTREDLAALTAPRSAPTGWEKHVLSNIWVLLALRHLPAAQPIVADGVAALLQAQNEDGGIPFITGLEIFCTATAGLALHRAGADPQLLRRMADYLLGQQKANGGWAHAEDMEQTDVDDTAYALEFLRSFEPQRHPDALARAEAYLLTIQGDDGGFPTFARGADSEIAMTAGALNALAPDRAEHAASITRGLRYVAARQKADGTFERSWSLSESNAIFRAVRAFQRLPPAAADLRSELATVVGRAHGYLATAQNPDGGWGQRAGDASDPISTSYALLALDDALHREMRQRGAAFLVSRQLPDGRFPSPPDQTGPRPMAWNVPVLSEIFALMALS